MTTVLSIVAALRAAGSYEFSAAQPIPDGLTSVSFQVTLSIADKLLAGNSMNWQLFTSTDSGVTWDVAVGGGWIQNPSLNDPIITMNNLNLFAGRLFKAKLTLDEPMTAGLVITVV